MGCRCSDIKQCSSDLRKISGTRSSLGTVRSARNEAAQALYRLAAECHQVFESAGMNELWSVLTTLTEPYEEDLSQADGRLRDMYEDVGDRRDRYEREDDQYHDDED